MIVLEGIRDLALPCTAALTAPLVVLLAAGRFRAAVGGGLLVGAMITVWAGPAFGLGVVGAWPRIGAAAAIAAGGALAWRSHRAPVAALGAALAAVPVAAMWQPCVGPRLGAALTAAPTEPLGQLLPLLLWSLGATLPVTVAVAIRAVVRTDGSERTSGAWTAVAVAGVGLLALTVAAGRWHDVVGALVRASS